MTALLERKVLTGVAGTKVLDEQQGIVECLVSVTGIRDEVKDIILPNAYEKTLAARKPKGVSGHDWEKAVARALEAKELFPGDSELPKVTATGEPWPAGAGALKIVGLYNLETSLGRDTYSNVKFFGPEQEWSIGYSVPRGGARLDHKADTRNIDTLDLFEWSDVLFGAAPLTAGSTNVKRYGGIRAGLLLPDGGIPAEKVLIGSYEERRDMLDQALSMRYLTPPEPGEPTRGWVSIRGTYDDRVVVRVYDETKPGGGNHGEEYEVEYIIRDGVVDLGTSRTVRVEERVVADDRPNDDTLAAGPTEGKAEDGFITASELLLAEDLWATVR